MVRLKRVTERSAITSPNYEVDVSCDAYALLDKDAGQWSFFTLVDFKGPSPRFARYRSNDGKLEVIDSLVKGNSFWQISDSGVVNKVVQDVEREGDETMSDEFISFNNVLIAWKSIGELKGNNISFKIHGEEFACVCIPNDGDLIFKVARVPGNEVEIYLSTRQPIQWELFSGDVEGSEPLNPSDSGGEKTSEANLVDGT
ncbi:hypothetical protein [Stieleria varia]|uniref:hypothetical protein n=1 Tax=Stieleria varia TaxID=2528005 RepID=UPI0011B84194|nr:hypothetical protein [Stieleria varia]